MGKELMERAVAEVVAGEGCTVVAKKYGINKGSLHRAVAKFKAVAMDEGLQVADTVATASPLQERAVLETDKSGAMGSSVSVEPATVTPVVDGLETIGDRTETEGVSVASDVSSETTVTTEADSVTKCRAGNEGVSVDEFAPSLGASADASNAELENLRAENALLHTAIDELGKTVADLVTKHAEQPAPDPSVTFGCGMQFVGGNSVQCEACKIETAVYVKRCEAIFKRMLVPRPLTPEEKKERAEKAQREWERWNAEFRLWAEFSEQQPAEIVAERSKLPGDEQERLDRIDFRDWLLNVKFKGTSEATIDELMGSWFSPPAPADGREPAVSESGIPESVASAYPVKITPSAGASMN